MKKCLYQNLSFSSTGTNSSAGINIGNFINQKDFTNNSLFVNNIYTQKPQFGTDILSTAVEALGKIENLEIRKNCENILRAISRVISSEMANSIENYLSKMHLTQISLEEALLEWNFDNFRFGFNIEKSIEETSIFYVSRDYSKGTYDAKSFPIEKTIEYTIQKLFDYVIRNT